MNHSCRRVLAGAFGMFLLCGQAAAVEIRFQKVAEGVYAFIGEKGARSYENEGMNANIGLVVTAAGAVLIDAGASEQGARKIAAAAKQASGQAVKWVINTGGQDHRWLGNGYFKAHGAEIIAHADAKADMQARGGEQLAAIRTTLRERADGTELTLPTRYLDGNDTRMELGGETFEFRHRGGAHTPGDTLVWLPQKKVLFSGDTVYVDRMLGVLPVSHTGRWLETFAAIEQIDPAIIVPGHGEVTDLAKARADTRDYLQALRAHMKKAVEDGIDLSAAVRSFDGAPYLRLLNAAELMPGNASRTYLEVELE
jgi:glyoxylase-like metal-dependent hydrolase (beta-lactamase superfamily II)